MTDKPKLNLYQKLSLIRSVISVKKTGDAKIYKYYEIDEICNKAKQLFNEHGVFTFFSLLYNPETSLYRGSLTVVDADDPQTMFILAIDSPLHEGRNNPSPCQLVGSNKTYQSRYLMMELLMLDDGRDDPDIPSNQSTKPKSNPVSTKPKKDFF